MPFNPFSNRYSSFSSAIRFLCGGGESKVAVPATLLWAKCPPYIALCVILAVPVAAQTVPSGQPVTLQEVLIDAVGTESWLRFRYIAPEITRDASADPEITFTDMTHLCEAEALPYIADFDLSGDVIVISLADRATEFGIADPEATQFFEAFRVQDDACIWESQ